MFINPQIPIEEKWIVHPSCNTFDDWKKLQYVSSNAIDFTLDHLSSIHSNNEFCISEGGKRMRGNTHILPVLDRRENVNYWQLKADSIYDGMSDMYVDIPEGIAALLVTRSTFVRNGIFLMSGLWDSLFCGNIGFVIHNRSGIAKVGVGTRIGQLIFVESNNFGGYAGGYNTEDGELWYEARNLSH